MPEFHFRGNSGAGHDNLEIVQGPVWKVLSNATAIVLISIIVRSIPHIPGEDPGQRAAAMVLWWSPGNGEGGAAPRSFDDLICSHAHNWHHQHHLKIQLISSMMSLSLFSSRWSGCPGPSICKSAPVHGWQPQLQREPKACESVFHDGARPGSMRCKSLQLRWQKLFGQSFSTSCGRWGWCGWPKSLLKNNSPSQLMCWRQYRWNSYELDSMSSVPEKQAIQMSSVSKYVWCKSIAIIFLRFPENMSGQVYGLAISNTSAHVCTLGHLPNSNSRFPVAQSLFSFPGATKHKQLYLLIFVAHIMKIRGKHTYSLCGIDFYFVQSRNGSLSLRM